MRFFRFCAFALCNICFTVNAGAQTSKSYKLFFEKVYLHTDREHYAAGEDLWFKAYLVNAQTNHLFNSSNNLYVELIDPQSGITGRKVIRMDGGLGKGNFTLSDSLPEGTYWIRAYTSWIRNFGDNFVFKKRIHIYSDMHQADRTAAPVSPNKKAKKAGTTAPPVAARIPPGASVVRFFPESGSMTENVGGLLAFKAEDGSGRGIAVKGSIVNSKGTEVAPLEGDDLGMGAVMLRPLPLEKYYARGTYGNGKAFNTELPQALLRGFSMNVRNSDSLLRITISTNEPTFETLRDRALVLIFKNRGKAYFSHTIPLKNLQTTLDIQKSAAMPAGISSLTLYDDSGKPQCERLVYIAGENGATLRIATDKTIYAPKGKVTVRLKASDEQGLPVKANISLAAVDAGIVPENDGNIMSYLNLQSELKGKIESAGRYFDKKNARRNQQLDLLLMTQGWRDYTWKRLADSTLRITYPLEQGITISGRVRQTNVEKPVIGANITLLAGGAKGSKLLSFKTDSAGKYYFDGLEFYGSQSLKLTSRNNKGEKSGWILLDSIFTKSIPVVSAPSIQGTAPDIKLVKEALINRSEKSRSLNDTIQLSEVIIKGSKYVKLWDQQVLDFGYPQESFEIQPKDSVYKTLEHFLRVNLRHNSSIFGSRFDSNGSEKIQFPRLFVNGKEQPYGTETISDLEMMINYFPTYYGLSMEKVQRVTVKHMLGRAKEYYWITTPQGTIDEWTNQQPERLGEQYVKVYGNLTSGAGNEDIYIIYLTLKPGAMDRKEHDIINQLVNGYTEAKTFYAPLYPSADKKPDLRTTVHWEPDIRTDENGEATMTYYNADPKTAIRIVVEGISDTGVPIAGTAEYEVR